MEKIITATGKQFDCDSVATIPEMGIAYIRVLNADLPTVASVFGNPNETVQLWYEDVYISQHTKLSALIPEGNAIRVNLKKE